MNKSAGSRVCLIGTSNSIYQDGYAGAIRDDERVTFFQKHSMGASPSIIIPYFGSMIDFSNFDWVIFETAINDRNYYKYGSIRKDQIRKFIEWGIAAAAAAGCKTALLVMPSRKAMGGPTISGLVYQRIAAETGAIYVDGYDYIRAYSSAVECPIDSLFLDDFHIDKPVAHKLGKMLLDKMFARKASSITPPRSNDRYYRIGATAISEQPLRNRKNTLMSEQFAVLTRSTTERTVRLAPGQEVVGIAFNAARSSGRVVLASSSGITVKSLTTKYYGAPKDLLLLACPLVKEIRAESDGRVTIRCGSENEASTEPSRFAGNIVTSKDDDELEIAALIIRSSRE